MLVNRRQQFKIKRDIRKGWFSLPARGNVEKLFLLKGLNILWARLPTIVGDHEADVLIFSSNIVDNSKKTQKTLLDLLKLSGFHEPFLSQSETESERWRIQHGTRLVRVTAFD